MPRHLIPLILLALTLPARAADAPPAPPPPVFPIMAWNHAPNDPAVLKKMRDCGLTVAGFVSPETLDACHAAGLQAIVSDARLSNYDWSKVDPKTARDNVKQVIDKVRNHPAVLGYYLRDEPSAALFPGLATVSQIIQELHPGAWPYINLFPNYANGGQLAAPTYQAYLDQFVATCKPPVLSYDHYALFEGNRFEERYFLNLEQMRNQAAKHGLPFWNIVQSVACLSFREPSAADLRFQAYTSLAYGARGLAWFTYFAPEVGNFRAAPIDQFGNPTQTWQWMQNVNLQVGKLAPTLLQLKSDRVYHFGKVPHGSAGPDDQSLVKNVGGQILVGDFTHAADGARYALCVNKDFAASVFCRPEFRQPVNKLEMVSPYTGKLIPYDGEQCYLAPGQGVLLRLTP